MSVAVPQTPVSAVTPRLSVHRHRLSYLERASQLLAWLLLAWQLILPWTAAHFITQDGSAHLYNGIVARSLLLHANSPYAGIYELRSDVLPNWGSTAFLALTASLVGISHAEQALLSLLILTGWICFRYALRSIPGNHLFTSPLINCLLMSFFLFRGYYNLYFGTTLLLFITGYVIRHATDFTMRRTIALGSLLTALFFVHIVPSALSVIVVVLLFTWLVAIVPLMAIRGHEAQMAFLRNLRTPAAHLACAIAPACLLLLTFASNVDAGHFPSNSAAAWHNFPANTFFVSANRIGRQELISPALLAYIACGFLLLRRREWLGARGGIALVAAVLFLLYLYAPNSGFGGGDVKIRFAWAFFLMGGTIALSVPRLRRIHAAFSIFLGLLLTGTLITTQDVNSRASHLADVCLQALDKIPARSAIIRVKYEMPSVRREFDIPNDSPSDVFYHIDSFATARRSALSLSDYEAPSGVFPVIFTNRLPPEFQSYLWGMEAPQADTIPHLATLLERSPVKVDYVLVFGETGSHDGPALQQMLTMLDQHKAKLIASVNGAREPFLRLYQTAPVP